MLAAAGRRLRGERAVAVNGYLTTIHLDFGAVDRLGPELARLGVRRPLLVHHGTLNAVIRPTVLAFNAGHVAAKHERIRSVAGLPAEADLGEWIRELNARLGLPASLRAMGVVEADLAGRPALAERDHGNASNPRPATAADYARLYREAPG